MSEKIDTYSPPTEPQTPLEIKSKVSGFEDVIEKNGIISTRLNEKVIIQRIAKDLYKNASSGLRELYNNAARTCRLSVKNNGETNPMIIVTMNETNRTLVIEDNGVGITKEVFKQVLLELGTSDNLDGTESGQWGMGFASYTTLSSVVIIDTKARNGDSYKMLAKDGMSYQPVGDSTKEGYGTRLEMTCYPEVSFTQLVLKLKSLAKYSGIKTILEIQDFESIPDLLRSGENVMRQTSFDAEVSANTTPMIDVVNIETKDFRLVGLASGIYAGNNSSRVHLINTPIDSDIVLPFGWWVLNIKDERKYQPMPDRDRMREVADIKLSAVLNEAIKDYFADLEIKTYQEFLDSDRKNEFLWLTRHREFAPDSLDLLLDNFCEVEVRRVVYNVKPKSIKDSSLTEMLSGHNKVIYQGYKNELVTDKCNEFRPDELCITVKKTKHHEWKDDVEFMAEFGIPQAKQIMIDHRVKMPQQDKIEFELVGHTHPSSYEHDIVDLDEIDENFIRCDTVSFMDVQRFVKKFKNPYTIVRNAKELDDYDSRNFSEWVADDIPNIMCATNKGGMSIKEIVESGDEYIFCDDYEENMAYQLSKEERIVIYGTDQLLPMAFYLNPNCERESEYSQNLKTPVEHEDFYKFTENKLGFSLWHDFDRNYYAEHMVEINDCFHSLFGNLLTQNASTDESLKIGFFDGYLEEIKTFKKFNFNDMIARMTFYQTQLKKVAGDTTMYTVLDELHRTTKANVSNDEELMVRLVKEVILPEMFTDLYIRKIERIESSYSYRGTFIIDISTKDKAFQFDDNIEILGWSLSLEHVRVDVQKKNSAISFKVEITH